MDKDPPDYENKSVFLKKDDDIIGIHAIGDSTEFGWQQLEAWCNAYSNDWKFLATIYRIFGPVEDEVAELKKSGWIEVQKPT